MDDLAILGSTTRFDQNIDYLEKDIDVYNLYRCWRITNSVTIKLHNEDISTVIPSSVSKRLENVCWRRWYRDMHQLPVISPSCINWYKDQDVTWLYGPKFSDNRSFAVGSGPSRAEGENKHSRGGVNPIDIATHKFANETLGSQGEEYLSSSPESCMSDFGFGTSPSSSTIASDGGDYASGNDCYSLKPAFKLMCNSSSKKVKFNYVVNSREFVNGLSVDYLFLDHQCL